ncbi:MAG: hypothetical protein HOU81_22200 [Hamadaea sp.]|uniref:hypothetical protein n=1 Tax=Hamadaea sp. TaxID=2024425 RepID=UPI0017D27B5E|nr:hypothetical protein [Hamadaea sp.]NUR73541.1 hypothetical protein [Hamadaea sp.]NUT19778.1 hypothetical protein [Hamadaea sp.]
MNGSPSSSVKVGLGRSNVVLALGMVVFLGWITFVAVKGSIQEPDAPLGYVIGGIFGLVLIFLLIKLPVFLRGRSLEFDAAGLRFWHGSRHVLIRWDDVVAVGIAYEQAPQDAKPKLHIPSSVQDEVKGRVADFLNDQAHEVLQISGKRRIALEIYPRQLAAIEAYPKLRPYWQTLAPPEGGLPPAGWRLPLPPVVTIAQAVGRGAETYQPHRWLGWYARAWSTAR